MVMNEAKRHEDIVKLIDSKESLSVVELTEMFNISPATARRDIIKLAEANKVKKVRNGIVRIEDKKPIWTPLDINNTDNYHEKARIAIKAATLIKDGESIILNCGSTAFLLGRELCGKNVNIITNYFPLASYLIEHDHENVTIIGGQYNKTQNIILNPTSELSAIYSGNIMFTSGKQLTPAGLYKSEIFTAVSEQQILNNAQKLVVVVDSTKVTNRIGSGMLFCPTSKINVVITGKSADKTVVESLKKQGVEVILV